jgi:hypothetical protein
MPVLDRISRFLQAKPGMRYCAPCLAKAAGIADANQVRQIMTLPRPEYRPGLTLETHACEACHTVRRTLSLENEP